MLKIAAFTLIELLIALAIAGLSLMFIMPYASSLQQKNQLCVVQDDITSAIRFAKTQALISDNNIILTPLPGMTDWSHGISAFVDNATHQYTLDDQLLFEWHWQSSAIEVTWHGFQSSQYLLFAAESHRNAANGYFLIKAKSLPPIKLLVNRLGRVRDMNI